MANRTDPHADTVHGTNPQYLVDRIVRSKIYNDAYWKEHCFGLTTESLIDKASEMDYVGGTYGGRRRPARFLCLFLKLLQIQPDEDVVMEYIRQPDLKYLRAVGAMYLRISARPMKVLNTLEPLFGDYRKLRYRDIQGKLSIIHMDEFIDWLLREETVCDVTMPLLPKRETMEETMDLPPRQSVLEDDLEDLQAELDEAEAAAEKEKAEAEAANAPPSPALAAAAAADQSPAKEEAVEEEADYGEAPRSPEKEKDAPPPRERERERERRRSRSPRAERRNREETPGERRQRDEAADRRKRSASGGRSRSRRRGRSDSKQARRERKEKKEKIDKKERKEAVVEENLEKREKKEKPKEEKWKMEKKQKKEKKDKGDKADKGDKNERTGPRKDKDGLSVEEWNRVRSEMGLKPLKS